MQALEVGLIWLGCEITLQQMGENHRAAYIAIFIFKADQDSKGVRREENPVPLYYLSLVT